MTTLTRTEEIRTGSLLSVGDRDALDKLMNGPSRRIEVPGAAGQLAVVMFRGGGEDDWPTWVGVRKPQPHEDGAPQDEDILYGRTGGSFNPLGTGKLLGFGLWARFTRYADGDVRLTEDSLSDCKVCPPGEGREILSESLAWDAERATDGRPVIAPDMCYVARDAAETWPFEDPILRAAAASAVLECLARQ